MRHDFKFGSYNARNTTIYVLRSTADHVDLIRQPYCFVKPLCYKSCQNNNVTGERCTFSILSIMQVVYKLQPHDIYFIISLFSTEWYVHAQVCIFVCVYSMCVCVRSYRIEELKETCVIPEGVYQQCSWDAASEMYLKVYFYKSRPFCIFSLLKKNCIAKNLVLS